MSGVASPRREAGVALVVAAVAALGFAGTFTFDEVPPALREGLGAAEFPRLICIVILALAALLALQEKRSEAAEPVPATGWWTFAACAGFLPVMAVIGMLPAMFLFVVAVGRLWGERRIALLLASGAGLVAAIWLVFVRVFAITLPAGWLGEQLLG
nr:tripartite tricarboxylate transporter TctB family protein [Plastoroseomonas hellenica]